MRAGDRALDVGAGSAVLSIVAALLGAGDVLALEADPWAIEPALGNVEANGVADRVEVRERTATVEDLRALEPRDLVVSNIEFGVLRSLLPGLVAATAPDGHLLLSGVLDEEWDAMVGLVAGLGVAPVAVDADEGWRSGLFRR